MANPEHVERLKQGVDGWNAWRAENTGIRPDLSEADLHNANLYGANLRDVDLHGSDLRSANLYNANLYEADLRGAGLRDADLRGADLRGANLSWADLRGANLNDADLSDADLRGADLHDANLSWAGLRGADLHDADLIGANLNRADLRGADLRGAKMWDTIIADVDLRETKGLNETQHEGPSQIGLYSVQLPQDGSALRFLRGAGVPDEWINDYHVRMMHPIQYHSLFISYSSKDDTLARRLHADLQDNGVRCWFAPEDLKIGDRFHSRIDEAIHLQDKLLLLLSEHAIRSDWVEIEVRAALEKEQRQHRDVLFPIRLDDSVIETSQAWATMLRQSRHIGDFTTWMDPKAYQIAFERLLRDLKQS